MGRIESTKEKRKRNSSNRHCRQSNHRPSAMERPPSPPQQPPQQPFVRGYKFVWRILLISNLALGAYIFTRPRKKDARKKDKKHTEPPSAPDITDSESPAISPSHEPESAPESQW